MEAIFTSAVELLRAYPEAPYVIGAISLIFLVSLVLVVREITGWFLKISSLHSKLNKIEKDLKSLNFQIEQLSKPNEARISSEMPKQLQEQPVKKELPLKLDARVENKIFTSPRPLENEVSSGKGFPLSH